MKRRPIVLSTAALIAVAAGIVLIRVFTFMGAEDMQTALHVDFAKVDEVELRYGLTGGSWYITDKKGLQNFFELFKGEKLKDPVGKEPSTGYTLSATMYENGKAVCLFTFGGNKVTVSSENGGGGTMYTGNRNFSADKVAEIVSRYHLG